MSKKQCPSTNHIRDDDAGLVTVRCEKTEGHEQAARREDDDLTSAEHRHRATHGNVVATWGDA